MDIELKNIVPARGYFLAALIETDEGEMDSVDVETSNWVKVLKMGEPVPGWEPGFSEGDLVNISRFSGKRFDTEAGPVMPILMTDVRCWLK